MRRTEHGRLWLIIVGIGCITGLLHAANLSYLAAAHHCDWIRLACPGPITPWVSPDSLTYLATADEILTRGLLHASYVSRSFGYPLLLAAGKSWFGEPFVALWLAPLLAGVAATATAWITWTFTGRVSAATGAGLLFCAWPDAYRYTPLLLTDAVHAYLVVTAFAATLAWRRRESPAMALAAAGLWAAAQAIRSTFFLLPVILPLLLFRRNRSSSVSATAAAVWLASCLVPTFTTVLSLTFQGTTTESYRMAKTLSFYTVPVLKERMGLGSFAQLRQAAYERYNWMPIAERVEAETRESLEFLAAHPGMAVASVASELHDQMTSPLRPYELGGLRDLYPEWLSPPHAFLILFWLSAAVGWLLVMRSERAVAAFLVATAAMVMIPAALSHEVDSRLRLPIDLLSIPLVVVCWQAAGTVFGAADALANHRKPRRLRDVDRIAPPPIEAEKGGKSMRSFQSGAGLPLAAAALFACAMWLPAKVAAHPPMAEPAQLFASGITGPEGLAFTRDGGLIVGSTTGEVRRYTASGSFTVLANIGVRMAGITVLRDGRILVAAFNTNEIWSIEPSGAASVFASGVQSPNFIAQSKEGPIWVSSSFGGTILDVASGSPVVAATGLTFPNGLAIGRDHYLYVAETLLHRVVRLPIANDGSLGPLEVYATGLPLADGIVFDRRRNLLVVGGGTLKIVEAATQQVINVPTDPLSNWPSNLAFGRGKGFKRRDVYMANFGPGLGDGTTVIRFRYNHRGTKLVK